MKVLATKANLSTHLSKSTAGFTLVEVLVVVIMVGVLATIAAPSWIGFVNRQRVNKANDVVLAALQEAQREAKKAKLSYSVSFKTDNNIAQIAVHQGTSPSNWRNLGEELGIKPGQILLGTNVSNINTKDSSVTYASPFDADTPQTITFNYMGVLASKTNSDDSDTDLKIVVTTPIPGTTTVGGVKRCVIVKTLLGSMLTQKDDKCN